MIAYDDTGRTNCSEYEACDERDESCVSGESRTVGCESKGRSREGGVVVVLRRHPKTPACGRDETRVDGATDRPTERASERAIRRKINQISNRRKEPASTYVAEVRDAADRREGREVRIDRRRASRSSRARVTANAVGGRDG